MEFRALFEVNTDSVLVARFIVVAFCLVCKITQIALPLRPIVLEHDERVDIRTAGMTPDDSIFAE